MSAFRRHHPNNDNYTGKYDSPGAHNTSRPKSVIPGSPADPEDYRGNFRSANAFSKVLTHKRIDNLLMESHLAKDVDIPTSFYYEDARGNQHCISRQDMTDRLTHKIKVAKESGTMDNEQYQNYLYSSAERLNMDMAIFDRVITV